MRTHQTNSVVMLYYHVVEQNIPAELKFPVQAVLEYVIIVSSWAIGHINKSVSCLFILMHPASQCNVTYLSPVLMHLDYTDGISVYLITA